MECYLIIIYKIKW